VYKSVSGKGPDLVLLHGWSMNSRVWHDLAELLSEKFTLHMVDLPGHGLSEWQSGDFELETVLSWMSAELPEQAYYVGWSLGGLISLAFAQRFPDRVEKLVLLAATPCFVQQADWVHAMPSSVFSGFHRQLGQDQATTLQQFLLLQARGSLHSRQTIKALAVKMLEVGVANSDALSEGLSLLMNLDMRDALSELACPGLLLLGECDTLVPQAMVNDALALNAKLATSIIDGAGHAPFISHVDACEQSLVRFLLQGPTDV
jgi:pimeloyl-[acyl-carrier protein] methyl ester esterase